MNSLTMVQVFINICLGLGLGFLWIRIMRPPKDDPRLSRGLQLLQSKIAILEDLSDRTDTQVKQLGLILEEKIRDVQRQVEAAESCVVRIEQSMRKSQEVAKIFQDRIPHEEIIDRQNTIKYVRAAQLAHQGKSIEEIEQVVEIPRSELEFIVKVNRERLMFSVEQLPSWVKTELEQEPASNPIIDRAYEQAFTPPPTPSESLAKIGEEFRKAISNQEAPAPEAMPIVSVQMPEQEFVEIPAPVGTTIKPYQFPKITKS